MKKVYVLIFMYAIFLLGCGKTISYSLKEGEYYECAKTCPDSLTVVTLEDIRKQPELKWHNVKMDGKTFRIVM